MSTEAAHIFEDEGDLDALRRIDPRLVALALGRIDDDELAELLDRAVREADVRRAVEAFWPLDEEAKRQGFQRAQEALALHERGPARPHWALMLLPTGVTAAVVAGLCVLAIEAMRPLPLPAYDLELRGGYRTTRSAGDPMVVGRLVPGAPIELLFRPAEPVPGTAHAAIFRLGSEGLVRLDSVPEVSKSGSVRWRGTITSLLLGELGAAELVLAVQAGRRPTIRDVRRALVEPNKSTIRVVRTILVVEDP